MGKYSDDLAKRMRQKKTQQTGERLECAALLRGGVLHSGPRSHYEIRSSLGDSNPQASNLLDVEGFLTTTGRFVTRAEAQGVAVAAGQIRERQYQPLPSSDVDW
jgi:hypothetical protein